MTQIRDILTMKHNVISVHHLWSALRHRQYYNAMCELRDELTVLAALPNLSAELISKVERSLEKITTLIARLGEKN